jgi:DNA polymerase-3 subunit delta
MKIDYKSSNELIKNIANQKDYKAVLLYGDNDASVNSKYKSILSSFKQKQFDIVSIPQENLKQRESLLAEEFFSISMFVPNILYTLKLLEKENNFTSIIENLFEKNDLSRVNNFLVILANRLDTTSSLRKYAEKSKYIACIACYEEDVRSTNIFIGNKLREYNFIFGYDVVEYLANNIGNNNLIIENEIKKIDLYKENNRKLTIGDVQDCIVDVSSVDLNNFCNNFCSFNKNETFRILDKIFQEGIELVVVIRTLIRYFLQLQEIRFLVDDGNNIESVVSDKNRKIFWKQQNYVKIHIQKWSLNNINKMLKKMIDVEKSTKFSVSGKIEFENFVLKSFLTFIAL